MDVWLVVLTCFNHLEKYESQWEGLRIIPNIWETKKCSKPPTRCWDQMNVPQPRCSGPEAFLSHGGSPVVTMGFNTQLY